MTRLAPGAARGALAQDPDEPFDLFTREGVPLGRSKARRDVHRDGDWHRSLHIWVWGRVKDEVHVVFQRRSLAKDTSPGLLDVAVTGHARSGESLRETLREAEEEIGLALTIEDVVPLGVRRRSVEAPGLRDNEIQDIFACARPVAIDALRASPVEVSELVTLSLVAAKRLFEEGGAGFVPSPDGYYLRAIESLEAMCSGRSAPPFSIG